MEFEDCIGTLLSDSHLMFGRFAIEALTPWTTYAVLIICLS